MDQMALVDYISYTDKNGLPMGHSLKVMREYAEWVQNDFEVVYSAHASYLKRLGERQQIELPFKIWEGQDYSSIKGRIHQLFVSWINLKRIWSQRHIDYIWFCNIDFFLMVFLICHRCKKKKIIITTYLEKFEKGYQNLLARLAFSKVKLVITSNKAIKYQGTNKLYIPDYLYNGSLYEKYKAVEKEDMVVCVGAMGASKELPELIDVFNKNGCHLQIQGYFADKDLLYQLEERANKNIKIIDGYLQYDEYLELIGKAKYCILPYKETVYSVKTSGIILESIFLDTVPVCNNKLLQRWEVSGIGYNTIDELGESEWGGHDIKRILDENNRLIERKYSKGQYVSSFKKMINY